ncbi:gliding motility-associated peptidyl-prolyl isomerase GldI [Polaribacter sargassicola]|uniref:gliding motility-associated peptidyl-prolyl isomerase GldI n=1 Tax=Polaribacter sargassicola TaxID=2836891 RepID=UPI001F42CF91|nr:gliding motility-associated peptidyl-prolyl isomerase GldI [Polaribacter sp. DS7-9]MCG1037604.1 gliding motility-associated peptidyl-prolyl isomerase GldI [Polaribacter sp. DS7-9]
MKIKFVIIVSFFILGCTKTTPRKPINPKISTTILKETVAETKRLNKKEEQKILNLIALDSTKKYSISSNGFWYTYINKVEENTPLPKLGDTVELQYNITDLEGNVIYSTEELGIKEYKVDKEDFISALQVGIKLMKVGETITFVIPSYNAFGISGDRDRIGINQSIKSTVTLINIK